jgi:hypothetical protein
MPPSKFSLPSHAHLTAVNDVSPLTPLRQGIMGKVDILPIRQKLEVVDEKLMGNHLG